MKQDELEAQAQAQTVERLLDEYAEAFKKGLSRLEVTVWKEGQRCIFYDPEISDSLKNDLMWKLQGRLDDLACQ